MQNLNRLSRSQLIQNQRRHFQTQGGAYKNGLERTVLDKLNWCRGLINGGTLFALLGIGSVVGYGASLIMEKRLYDWHFKHSADGRFFQPFKAWFGCNNIMNLVWTAPCLILGGLFIQNKMGTLFSTKFFVISFIASYFAQCAFHPTSYLGRLNLRQFWPVRFDCIEDGKSWMGSDLMAVSAFYMVLFYHKYYLAGLGLCALDALYYGPAGVAPAGCALMTALTML